ncbi:hypothetical protein N7530_010194 [Penicillium desertorum]|uniref:Uncharacterized protein n=1 Tax=Penicillium desertorum TaxID=1303715 RepID=A0A9X0BIZ9_9EURO|nr:hypothetical protein N7530_010194 [Penicillium desertorum]
MLDPWRNRSQTCLLGVVLYKRRTNPIKIATPPVKRVPQRYTAGSEDKVHFVPRPAVKAPPRLPSQHSPRAHRLPDSSILLKEPQLAEHASAGKGGSSWKILNDSGSTRTHKQKPYGQSFNT